MLRESLKLAAFPESVPLITRRMGFKDGGEDLRTFQDAALDGHVAPIPSLLLRSALREARTQRDPAGNEKLSKSASGRRRNARDDVLAAAIIAVGAGRRALRQPVAQMTHVVV